MILGKKVRLEAHRRAGTTSCGSRQELQDGLFNWALDKQEKNYASGGKFLSDNDLRKELTQLKQTEEFSIQILFSDDV